jgi:monoamine oxidase
LKVCVVGAGFAGLAAADTLASAGIEVVVLEARNRVGGRVWSQRLDNGAVIERGAEYTEWGQDALLFSCVRHGLALAPAGVSFTSREPRGGERTTEEEIREAIASVRRLLVERPSLFRESAAKVLSEARIPSAARSAIASRVQLTSGYPVEDLWAYALIHVSFSQDEGLRIAGGNQSLALKIADRLGKDKVKLSSAVETIHWSPSSVKIETIYGDAINADACVIAVPASVLDRISFYPVLPKWKSQALADVKYGHAAKLFVPLKEIPPPSAVLSVPDYFWTWTAKDAGGNVQPVVSAFAGSLPVLEALEVKKGPGKWISKLKSLRPDLKMEADGAVLSTWSQDEWVMAAYSVRTPNMPSDRDDLLSRRVDCLHFAGEHTAGFSAATMNGAIFSGIRAAKEIIAP